MMRIVRPFLPVLVLFFIVNTIVLLASAPAAALKIDIKVVLSGNLILLMATLGSYIFYNRSIREQKMQAFLRNIYAGMFIKFGLCMMSAFFYILIMGKNVNKWGIITVLGLYLLYTIVEVVIVFRLNKK